VAGLPGRRVRRLSDFTSSEASTRGPNSRRSTGRTDEARGRVSRRYSEDEIARALYAVALASGNHARASRDLAEAGIDIPSRTLQDWTRDKHRHRYEEIKLEAILEIYSHLAARWNPSCPTSLASNAS
jgi:hypothetical protein